MKPLTNCPNREALERLLQGDVSDEQAQSLEGHLLDCPQCLAAAELIGTIAGVSAETIATGDSPVESLQALKSRLKALWQQAAAPAEGQIRDREGGEESFDPARLEYEALLAPPIDGQAGLGRLGPYNVLELLGAGGMGFVFLAEDPKLKRRVALKVLKPSLATAPENKVRFLREAQATAAVRNDHVIEIYHIDEDRGMPFFVMPVLQGETLDARRRAIGKFPMRDVLRIGKEIAAGLAAAHESPRRLIHRDIKPSNIWLEEPNDRVKILDFGLALDVSADVKLTHPGTIVGSAAYMSPEQANPREGRVDERSDLFAFGCVLYEMATGVVAFERAGLIETLQAVVSEPPTAPINRDPKIPQAFSELVLQMLSKDPAGRPASARNVIAALDAIGALVKAAAVAETKTGIRPAAAARPTTASIKATASADSRGRPPRRRKMLLFGGGALAAAILAGVIVIRLTHKDGSQSEIKLPNSGDVTSINVNVDLGTGQQTQSRPPRNPVARETPQPGSAPPEPATPAPPSSGTQPFENSSLRTAVAKIGPRKVVTLDQLDPSRIPKSEERDWQPDELVALLGEHQHRVIWDPNYISMRIIFHPSGRYFHAYNWFQTETVQRQPAFPRMDRPIFSPDGKWVCDNGQFYAVEGDSTQALRLGPAFTIPVLQAVQPFAFTPDSRWIVQAQPKAICAWDLRSSIRALTRRDEPEIESPAPFIVPQFSTDGRVLMMSVNDQVRFYDVGYFEADAPQFKLQKTIAFPPGTSLGMALAPDGRFAVCGPSDRKMDLFDLTGEKPVPRQTIPEFANCPEFSPDGHWFAALGGANIGLFRWDGKELKPVTRFPLECHFCCHRFSPDSRSLIALDVSGYLHSYDLTADPPIERRPPPPGTRALYATFSPDGSRLVSGGAGDLAFWDLTAPSPKMVFHCKTPDPEVPVFAPSGEIVAANDSNWIWNEGTPSEQPHFPVGVVRFLSDRVLLAGDGIHEYGLTRRGRLGVGSLRADAVFDVSTNNRAKVWSDDESAFAMRVEPKPNHFQIQVWDFKALGKPRHTLEPGDGGRLALNRNGTLLASGDGSGNINVWDLTVAPPRRTHFQHYPGGVLKLLFTPDGKTLICAKENGLVFFDWAKARAVRTFTFGGRIPDILLHPDGKHLATVNGDGSIYILRIPELLR